jgi:hypothetical protein
MQTGFEGNSATWKTDQKNKSSLTLLQWGLQEYVTFQSQVGGSWETYHSDPAPSGYEAVQIQAVTCEQVHITLVYIPWYEGRDQTSQLSG